MSNKESMLDRLARVAHKAWRAKATLYPDFDELTLELKQHYNDASRAQLKELRNPTLAMLKAGIKYANSEAIVLEVWRAMLNEALAGE